MSLISIDFQWQCRIFSCNFSTVSFLP